ncbi:SDR family NAD(P)-dependent oxidoreductase [Parvibaculaceae bacterium PLY_AMNH_Bact1]|nr:SDR family NAD(P)-dependent oxidoreductase [Parvibaculaceae bacterium PLY_AMNH_Bact1]
MMGKSKKNPTNVLVCGASGGLGSVLARTLQDRGMVVRGTMRDPSKSTTPDIDMLAMDVLNEQSVIDCLSAAKESMGSVDVVVNCVNEMVLGSVVETSRQELARVYDINVLGLASIARAAVPLMRTQGHGLIISMSSLGGLLAVPYLSAYTSSKFALEAFSEALYHEVKADNIDVAIMQPVAMHMDRAEVGDHLKVAKGAPATSVTQAIVRMMAKDTRESKLTPEKVSLAIHDVIKSKNRKLRYPLDRARVLGKVKRIAPQSLINKMIDGLVRDAQKAS